MDSTHTTAATAASAAHGPAAPACYHVRAALVSIALLAFGAAGLLFALWLASAMLCLSLHRSPLHAGLWLWPDAARAWYEGRLTHAAARIAGAALGALLVAFGVPVAICQSLIAASRRRRLYGDARFASAAEIHRAGLL